MTDRQLFQLVLRQLQHTIAYSNEEMKVLDDLKGLVRERLSQPEPEPVAWFTEDHREDKSATTYSKKMAERWREKGWPVTPLYTAPPQREWVGLTDEERRMIALGIEVFGLSVETILKEAEEKLKEKNT